MEDHYQYIHLKNFGPWVDQRFDLHSGVNVIIGESGHGKSNFIKAFDFVMNNETPKSADGALGFINRPLERGKIAEVVLGAYSGEKIDTITRTRGKTPNTYQLNDDTPQKAFGRGNVPDHIAKIINMNDVNYHKQKQLPFLLDEKPGQVAKQLTSIINLEEIDESVSMANASVRENKKILKQYIEDSKETSDQIKNLEYVQEFQAEVDLCLELEKDFVQKTILFNKVNSIVCDIDDLESQISQYSDLISLSDAVEAIEAQHRQFEADSAKFDKIVELVNQMEFLETKQIRHSKLIELGKLIEDTDKYEKALILEQNKFNTTKKIIKEISDLEKSSDQSKQLAKLSDEIEKIDQEQVSFDKETEKYNQILHLVVDVENLTEKKEKYDKQITDGELKLSTMICPLCKRKN